MARRTTKPEKVRRTARKGSPFWHFVKITLILVFLATTCVGGYLAAAVWQQLQDLPDISLLERYEPIEAIQVFDRNDRLICTVEGDEDRRVVSLSQIAPQMQQAILAAEDHHFYEHHGFNPGSFVRAFLANMQAGHVVEGGSTITMQLVKNLFFEDAGRTMGRKIKEVFISSEIETRYPKDKILEMYLNQVYFGNGGYGIERASSRYFDRSAASLSLAQSAFLAGLVKAPSELSIEKNRKAAISRQLEIIDKMVEYGYITSKQAQAARDEKLVFKKGVSPLQKHPYYVSYVLELLRARFSQSEMRKQGLRVFTNLDPPVQALAEKTLQDGIAKAPKGVSQGALVCIQVKDCACLAIVGGVGDFWKNQWNRATNPHTAGSSFKPFVYLTAFQKRTFSPDSTIDDSPVSIKQGWGLPVWQPKNFDHKYMGKITLRKALTMSRNIPSIKIAQAVGVDSIIETARRCGITSKLDPNLSLALGSSAVSPLELAGAYSTFARAGIVIHPQVIRKIENTRGQIIENFESRYEKAFDSEAVAELVSILQDVVRIGTGTQAKLADRPVAGKTGTADAGKDIWFSGLTPDTVTVVWGGNDDNLAIPGHNVTGGGVMAKIWRQFMEAYYKLRPAPPGAFLEPSRGKAGGADSAESEAADSTNDQFSPAIPKLVPISPGQDQDPATEPGQDAAAGGQDFGVEGGKQVHTDSVQPSGQRPAGAPRPGSWQSQATPQSGASGSLDLQPASGYHAGPSMYDRYEQSHSAGPGVGAQAGPGSGAVGGKGHSVSGQDRMPPQAPGYQTQSLPAAAPDYAGRGNPTTQSRRSWSSNGQ